MHPETLFTPRPWAFALLLAAGSCFAQTTIAYKTVAEAQKALEARDGDGTIVTHPEGWVVINEPEAKAQWSFTPAGYYAHPAVVKRVILRSEGKVTVETASLCEADKDACARLLAEFETMNERITQAVKARGRAEPPAAR